MPIPLLPDFQFGVPGMLLLTPVAILVALIAGRRGAGPTIVFPAVGFFDAGAKPARGLPGGLSTWLFALAMLMGVFALARPQKIKEYEVTTGEGVEIAVAIDVSFSMSVEDYVLNGQRINRLQAAKTVIKKFIEARTMDRIGLIIFSGRPHTLGPLTLDHDWLQATLERDLHFEHKIDQGTSIGTAIATSAKRLSDREAASKVIVLITDGDQTIPGLSPEDAAELAATLGIKVYPIAIGTPGVHYAPRARRPLPQSFDFETLEKVANITKGKAYQAKDTATLQRIFEEIDTLEKSEIERRSIRESEEYFQWPLALAVVLLALAIGWELSIGRVAPE